MTKSTKAKTKRKANRPVKPDKPYEGFPLFPHATGRWAKKIRGKLHYFGKWDDPEMAMEKFNREWPYLSEGRTPPPVVDGAGCTVLLLCNSFLTSKKAKLENGEITERTFRDYYVTCEGLLDQLGKTRRVDDLRPDDFEEFRGNLAKRLGTVSLKNEINRCRVVFKYAFDQRLVKEPIHYGQSFDRPSARMVRRSRNISGPKVFEAKEIRDILEKSDPIMKAMVLLGINTGFGNNDIASLPKSAVDFESGWIDFPRPKTEIDRRVPLWPETVEALREAIENRPEPKNPDEDGLCFITVRGLRWTSTKPGKRDPERFVKTDLIAYKFGKLLKELKINGRKRLGFYTLRHTFETIGGGSKDQIAVDAIMGHVDPSMGAVYRHDISDERLIAVTDTVHTWLFGK